MKPTPDQIDLRLAEQERRAARFRRWFGLGLGLLLALVYAFLTNGLVRLEMPGVPLSQPPLGAAGNILVWLLVGALLGLSAAWPQEGLYGVLISAAAGTLMIGLFTFFSAGPAEAQDERALLARLVSLVFLALPIAGLLVPLTFLLRWAISKITDVYMKIVPWWQAAWIPLALLVAVAWVGLLTRLPTHARAELVQTHNLIQQGLQAAERQDLPTALQSRRVGDFLSQASPSYRLEWDSQRVNRYAIPRPVDEEAEKEAVVVARFDNEWSLACLFANPRAEPSCKGIGSEEGVVVFTSRAPSPFEVAWDDFSLFELSLAPGEAAIEQPLDGATVYHVSVALPQAGSTLSGRMAARYTNREALPLNEIYLRLYPNLAGGASRVANIQVDGEALQGVLENQGFALRIPLPQALAPGESHTLSWDFEVEVPETLGGNYGLLSHTQDIWALDAFLPTIAVYDERGWVVEPVPPNGDNTFHDAAYYLVQVEAPREAILVASGSLAGGQVIAERQQALFAAGPARDFYLAASPRFVSQSEQYRGTLVRAFAIEELAYPNQQALRSAVDALRIFNQRYGPYPYSELEVVSLPMQAAGIEYPGVIGIGLDQYSGAPGSSSSRTEQVRFRTIIAHEVGHQWFYNLVGNDQAEEPWLDEALAQNAAWQFLVDLYGEGITSGEQLDYWRGCVEQTQTEQTPVGLPAGEYPDGRSYVGAVYCRGPLFIQELAQVMGREVFDKFLRAYNEQQRWEIATASDFKSLAEKTCQCDLDDLFEMYGITP